MGAARRPGVVAGAIAGVWDETRKKRQYCLFLNAPRGTRADEMVRYPLANRIHGHVSAIGGPTPGNAFCITYSSGATEIPLREWRCLAMTYDGKASRVYVDGRLDAMEQYNPFPYPDGLFKGGPDGADFTVGAVHRSNEWGNFFGGKIGGLAVFRRRWARRRCRRWRQAWRCRSDRFGQNAGGAVSAVAGRRTAQKKISSRVDIPVGFQ